MDRCTPQYISAGKRRTTCVITIIIDMVQVLSVDKRYAEERERLHVRQIIYKIGNK